MSPSGIVTSNLFFSNTGCVILSSGSKGLLNSSRTSEKSGAASINFCSSSAVPPFSIQSEISSLSPSPGSSSHLTSLATPLMLLPIFRLYCLPVSSLSGQRITILSIKYLLNSLGQTPLTKKNVVDSNPSALTLSTSFPPSTNIIGLSLSAFISSGNRYSIFFISFASYTHLPSSLFTL